MNFTAKLTNHTFLVSNVSILSLYSLTHSLRGRHIEATSFDASSILYSIRKSVLHLQPRNSISIQDSYSDRTISDNQWETNICIRKWIAACREARFPAFRKEAVFGTVFLRFFKCRSHQRILTFEIRVKAFQNLELLFWKFELCCFIGLGNLEHVPEV